MASDLTRRDYIRYDSYVPKVPAGEDKDAQKIAEIFERVMKDDLKKNGMLA